MNISLTTQIGRVLVEVLRYTIELENATDAHKEYHQRGLDEMKAVYETLRGLKELEAGR